MDREDYKEFVKNNRKSFFANDKPYDLVYSQFEKKGYHKQTDDYFFSNASEIIEELRKQTWNDFQIKEKQFTSNMLSSLYSDDDIKHMNSSEAITWFCENFPMHIYDLNLSNTQSRRSRAGKEFEAIIELILIGANIPLDSQGNIGKKFFIDKGLGKQVDIVSPGAVQYILNKRNTVLVSAKTTLRERWQEVPEEMGRTGAREMFLVTLDGNISSEVIETLNDANIQLVTTEHLKNSEYSGRSNVISFEILLMILKETVLKWENFPYSEADIEEMNKTISKQIDKHKNHTFVADYYKRYLDKL